VERKVGKFHGRKGKKGGKKRRERLEGFSRFIPCNPITARGLTVGERGENLAGERRTLARGCRAGERFTGEHWATPAGGGFWKPVRGKMPEA
jgi:hypothetical protein